MITLLGSYVWNIEGVLFSPVCAVINALHSSSRGLTLRGTEDSSPAMLLVTLGSGHRTLD